MSPPFSFGSLFRRKEKKPSEASQAGKLPYQHSIDDDAELKGMESESISDINGNRMSISNALDLLKRMDDEEVGDMFRNLIPIRQSLENTLLSIGRLAEEMENEKVKLEEEKFKPAVESSRKILVSSLKKEVSSEFPTPTSIPEAKKFQESLQSLMERFGDVSGSHSKLLTTFMKKRTGKIKGEFDIISSLERRTNKIIENFEEDRQPLMNCITVLNKTSQMADSIQLQEGEPLKLKGEISRLEVEDQELVKRLTGLEGSPDFESTSKTLREIELAQEEEKEFRKYLGGLLSPLSRALTKYSYGTSKATSHRLKVLMEEPWKIFERAKEHTEEDDFGKYDEQSGALESYRSLLVEVHKAVSTGKITLKDSDKTTRHFELIIGSLPSLQKKSELICSKLKSLEKKKDNSVISLVDDLRRKVRDNKVELENYRLGLEKLENEIKENKNDLQGMLGDCEECLSSLTRKNFVLEVPNQ